MKSEEGFTLIELVTVMIVIGILAVAVVLRLDAGDYRALEFHDQAVAALRYAQKTAVSHRRLVCVAFTATSVALTIDHDKSGACDNHALNLPGATTNTVQSQDATNAVFSPVPSNFDFQADGSGADRTLSISGQSDIVVIGATGYVQ